MLKMTDLNLTNQRVLIRVDFNVPIENGRVTSGQRILAALPTIEFALKANAKIILLSHLGRPKEGEPQEEFSLAPVADYLSHVLKQPVRLVQDWLDGVELNPGEIVLCENVRFCVGEKKDDAELAKKIARLCDVFVMDAFGTAHRAQASTHGVIRYAPIACAGPLLVKELDALARCLKSPEHPVLAIVGGSKVSSKLPLLESLANKVDQLIVGGGIANTFLAAAGKPVGKSLYEPDLLDQANKLMQMTHIPLPVDVVVAQAFDDVASAQIKKVEEVADTDMILDIGPESAALLAPFINAAKTIVWNGPVGVFEKPAFAEGTRIIAQAIAHSSAFSIAGGGDTLAAIDQFNVAQQISYISTGGGAFLEFLEGKILPAVAALDARDNF